MTHTYFAYGSNLDEARMCARCPSARPLGVGVLEGYVLGFAGFSRGWGGGVATVTPDATSSVPGLLWTLDAADLERLDVFEGHPTAYRRQRLWVVAQGGAPVHAEVYVKEGQTPSRPAPSYVDVLTRAYITLGFD